MDDRGVERDLEEYFPKAFRSLFDEAAVRMAEKALAQKIGDPALAGLRFIRTYMWWHVGQPPELISALT